MSYDRLVITDPQERFSPLAVFSRRRRAGPVRVLSASSGAQRAAGQERLAVRYPRRARRPRERARPCRERGLRCSSQAKLANFVNFCKFLAGSFSAVSKRNFARKYAFDSIFQALQDLHTLAPLQSQNFRNNCSSNPKRYV